MSVDNQRKTNVGGCTGKGFMPGTSGNPNGRPRKDMVVADAMREILSATEVSVSMTVGGREKTLQVHCSRNLAYAVAAVTVFKALKGDMRAVKELCDRVDGKPHQSIGIAPEPEPETPIPDEVLAEFVHWARRNGKWPDSLGGGECAA